MLLEEALNHLASQQRCQGVTTGTVGETWRSGTPYRENLSRAWGSHNG